MSTPQEYRYCIGCKHFWIAMGEPPWSDVTAGASAELICYKKHFHFCGRDAHQQSLERVMLRARSCQDYEERDAP